MKKVLFVFILCLFFIYPVISALSHSGARFYRGDLTVSTEWEGVVRVTGSVTVKKGVTLTIARGTRVLFNKSEDVNILVEGKLFIRGLPGFEVSLEPADGCEGGNTWGGIIFQEGSAGEIEEALFGCSEKGITGSLVNVKIGNVRYDPPVQK